MTSNEPLILIIEDEPPIRRFLRASLNGEGYRLNEARSGAEALRVAAEQPPDLVILDLGLPDIDGQEVLRRLREWLTAPIIVLSARDQELQKIKALDSGADDYVTKPFGIGELLGEYAPPSVMQTRAPETHRHSSLATCESTLRHIGSFGGTRRFI